MFTVAAFGRGIQPMSVRSSLGAAGGAADFLDTSAQTNGDKLLGITFSGQTGATAVPKVALVPSIPAADDATGYSDLAIQTLSAATLTTRAKFDYLGVDVTGTAKANDVVTKLSATNFVRNDGILFAWAGANGNVGTAEDDLTSYSLPAATLSADNQSIEIHCFGGFNTVGATARLYFNGVELDNVSAAATDDDWSFRATIIRTGATAQTAICETLVGTGGDGGANLTLPTATLANAVTIKVTGDGVSADNEVMARGLIVSWRGNSTY